MDDIATEFDETFIEWYTPWPLAETIQAYHTVPIDKDTALSIAKNCYQQLLQAETGSQAYLDYVNKFGEEMLDPDALIYETGFNFYEGYDPFWGYLCQPSFGLYRRQR